MSAIRVLVVDDSVVVRRMVSDVLSAESDIEVIGVAANGKLALNQWDKLKPDVITMDIEMPEMNGIEAVRNLRMRGCRVPILMFSTLTERGATATLDALAAGATDYVTKPANVGSVSESKRSVRDQLVPLIRSLLGRSTPGTYPGMGGGYGFGGSSATRSATAPRSATLQGGSATSSINLTRGMSAGPVTLYNRGDTPIKPVRLVVLGSSTGGPEALSKVIQGLNRPLPVPLVITQHMPPVFTQQLAARLDRMTTCSVQEASEGTTLRPGMVYIAPGDFHMEFAGNSGVTRVHLTKTPPVNFCRPSVDVMFNSAVDMFGGELLAVVLTGMGQDGRDGCNRVLEAGGQTVVQDERTSVVWGMPGAVANSGLAEKILPIDDIASYIICTVGNGGR